MMTKLGLILLALVTLLAGCGGGSKTVTVTGTPPGAVPPAATTTAACFKAAGAAVRGPKPAGRGYAVYATTRHGSQLGVVKAPSGAIAGRLAFVFASSGYHTSSVKTDPTAFVIFKDTPKRADAALLSKCAK